MKIRHWRSESMFGLILFDKEIEEFEERYVSLTKAKAETPYGFFEESISEGHNQFDASEDPKDRFGLFMISPENGQGMFFTSWDTATRIDAQDRRCLLVLADEQPCALSFFRGSFYKNFHGAEEEFRRKLLRYLPEDFTYGKRIGTLSFVYEMPSYM